MNTPIDLSRIQDPPIEEGERAEAESRVEQMERDLDKKRLDVEEQANRIRRDEDVYEFRKQGYQRLSRLIEGWLFLVSIFLLGSAIGAFKLSDPVLIALLTTSTATVLGIFAIAAKWLFPKK